MIVQFSVSNYRSVRNKATLSFLASADTSHEQYLRSMGGQKILPVAAVYGANASGKSSILMALQLLQAMVVGDYAQLLKDKPMPHNPFAFISPVSYEPTSLEIIYYYNDIKYAYGYSYNAYEIVDEYLYHWPRGREALIFSRKGSEFKFTENKAEQKTLAGRTPANRLYLVSSNEWNLKQTEQAYRWFTERLSDSGLQDTPDETARLFKRDRKDGLRQRALEEMLVADLGISEIEIHSISTDQDEMVIRVAHKVNDMTYELPYSFESNGTQKFFSRIGPWVSALQEGNVIFVDEIEASIHPLLTKRLVEMLQDPSINTKQAQLLFTTHEVQLLDLNLLRRDQIWFTEKDDTSLETTLFPLSDYHVRKDENVLKGYMQGRYGAIPFLGGDGAWEE